MQVQDKMDTGITIYGLTEQAITVEFGQQIGEKTLKQVRQLDTLLRQKPFPGFRTTVPAYTTLSVFFDPAEVIKNLDLRGFDAFEKVSDYIRQLKNEPCPEEISTIKTVTIPVCYGGPFGLDLEEIAILHNLSVKEAITLHSAAVYEVYMMGFVPGFAYLGGMSDLLETPRKASPRKFIPAGSVGIAGKQTGIYPLKTPGGWQIIGQTPLTLFDAERPQPALLKSGDRVVFKPIGQNEFEQYRD